MQYERKSNDLSKFVLKENINEATEQNLRELLIPDEDLGTVQILEFNSLSEYYTICMVLGLVDSV
jgi:hypothetical protein|nr:MAG TPA: hypothetical protein [Caudoviricetes sp.]